ncbi:hypothetical protein [Actinomadura spongiicola]|uniref:hypothetical protein n=1 Tax=Actinomadura spongiicola TaxID=2303421 RepID=UPI0011C0F1CB|nr:hypothetical protein [Actinomadura spongiicola]
MSHQLPRWVIRSQHAYQPARLSKLSYTNHGDACADLALTLESLALFLPGLSSFGRVLALREAAEAVKSGRFDVCLDNKIVMTFRVVELDARGRPLGLDQIPDLTAGPIPVSTIEAAESAAFRSADARDTRGSQ